MIDFVEMKCKYCGGQLKLSESAEDTGNVNSNGNINSNICGNGIHNCHAYCEYCGKEYLIDTGSPENVYHIYQAPKTRPETDLKPVLIAIAAICAAAIILFVGTTVFTDSTDWETAAPAEPAMPEKQELSPLFEAMLQDAFGKSSLDVTEEELSSIKSITLTADAQYSAIVYTTKEPDKANADQFHQVQLPGTAYQLSDLSQFKGLVSVDVGGRSLHTPLTELTQLKSLRCGNSIEELTELTNPAQLESLTLQSDLDDLTGIDAFSSLTSLSVDSHDLTNIDGLSALPGLTKLSLSHCQDVSDFSVLSALKEIQDLSLVHTSVKDIGFISDIPRLSVFNLTDSQVMDLSPLSGKDSLASLTLGDCEHVSDFSPVSSLTELTKLDLDLYTTQTMPSLTELRKLQELSIRGIIDISFLSGLPQLKSLSIYGCNVSEYRALESLTELEYLSMQSIWGNLDLNFLSKLTKLKTLDLSGGEFYDTINEAFTLPALETLILNDCSFSLDMSTLPVCETLTCLQMDRVTLFANASYYSDDSFFYADYDQADLSDVIGFLQNYPNLRELSLSGDKLTDISFTESMQNLEALNIQDNYVTDLRPLDRLQHLRTVYCGDNAISKYPVSEKVMLIE